jgi:hypothetical protein
MLFGCYVCPLLGRCPEGVNNDRSLSQARAEIQQSISLDMSAKDMTWL